MKHYYTPHLTIIARHLEEERDICNLPSKFTIKRAYNIGVLGALGKAKGADRLENLANLELPLNSTPLHFILIGYAYRELKRVSTTGKYRESEAKKILKENGIDIILFTATWPETYSYTLSIALASGLPIIAPNIGAFPERLANRDNTFLYPYDKDPQGIINDIFSFIYELFNGISKCNPSTTSGKYKEHYYKNEYLIGIRKQLGKPVEWQDLEKFNIQPSISFNKMKKRLLKKISRKRIKRWLKKKSLRLKSKKH